jgi:hypothetical protein
VGYVRKVQTELGSTWEEALSEANRRLATKAEKQQTEDDEEKLRDRMVTTFIRSLLSQIDMVKGKGNKVVLTATLFSFINDNAIHFVRRHGTFAAVCTAKAIELMGDAASIYPNLRIQLVAFLRAMHISEQALKKFGA